MLEDAFLVCSESCLISSATTAKPFPASPALAASIEAFNARRLVWLEISTIEPINPCTSSTFSVRLLITSTIILLASCTFCACSLSSTTIALLSLTVSSVLCEASTISLISFSAISVFSWISAHIVACLCMASAVLSVLSAISFIELWFISMLFSNSSSISIACPKCLVILSATTTIFSLFSFCITAAASILFIFSAKNCLSSFVTLRDIHVTITNTNIARTLLAITTPLFIL